MNSEVNSHIKHIKILIAFLVLLVSITTWVCLSLVLSDQLISSTFSVALIYGYLYLAYFAFKTLKTILTATYSSKVPFLSANLSAPTVRAQTACRTRTSNGERPALTSKRLASTTTSANSMILTRSMKITGSCRV